MNIDAGFRVPDIHGRRVIITGANSGIGLAAARALAAAGADVTLAVRDVEKGARAAESVSGSTEVRSLDLANLASVRAFAAAWEGPIDLLINNAGVMATPLRRTQDGFELQFGTNHLGHFALTNLLLRDIVGRVVTVSSIAHRQGRIDFDDLGWERRRYNAWAAYGQSKLANLLFTLELQRRLGLAGSDVLSVAAHPGYAATNLQSSVKQGGPLHRAIASLGETLLAQSADAGAQPTLYAALADIPGSSFVGPDGFMQMRGAPRLVTPARRALDNGVAMRLWRASEELTGTAFPL
jgi:NAD(P)-dependent dehydrogenase (short-subunit alcohol dehydrogenase family)